MTPSSRNLKLRAGANTVHGRNAIHRKASSQQPPKRQNLVYRGSNHLRRRRTSPKSAGVHCLGRNRRQRKEPLVFVDEGVKINQNVYRQNILETVGGWAAALRQCVVDVSTRLTPAYSAKCTQHVGGPFSGLRHFCRMATALPGSESEMAYSMWPVSEIRVCSKGHHFV